MIRSALQYGLSLAQANDIEVKWRLRDWLAQSEQQLVEVEELIDGRVHAAAAAAWEAGAFTAAHQMVVAALEPVARNERRR